MQEEISLRKIIVAILNGKRVIIVTTIIAMLISGIYSYFLLSPTYQATSTIRLGDSSQEQGEASQQALNSFTDSVKTDVSLNRIIDKLKLDRKEYNINTIRDSVQVEVIKNTNVMKLTVKGKAPSQVTNIANLLAYELGSRIEISFRSEKIVKTMKRMNELNDLIIINSRELEAANIELGKNPEKQVTKQTLADEPYLQSIIGQTTELSNKQLGALQLQNENINPVYTALKQRIADSTIQLTINLTELQNLEKIIFENNAQIELLEQKLDEGKLSTLKSERLLSEYSAIFISPAIRPLDPIGPNGIINIAISAIIGIMLSVMIVLIRQYLRDTSEEVSIKEKIPK